jgi:hypothetical protein
MQGPPCKTCTHPQRARIELGLARGVSASALSRRFKLSADSILRHRKHISPKLMAELRQKTLLPEKELQDLTITESSSLLGNLVAQRAKIYTLIDQCEELGSYRDALAGHSRLSVNLEQTGKLLDLFASHATTVHQNLVISPDYLQLRQALLRALAPYQEARRAVVAVLRELEEIEPEPPDPPRKVIALNPPSNSNGEAPSDADGGALGKGSDDNAPRE